MCHFVMHGVSWRKINDVPSEDKQVLIDRQKECTKDKTMKLNHWLSENTNTNKWNVQMTGTEPPKGLKQNRNPNKITESKQNYLQCHY